MTAGFLVRAEPTAKKQYQGPAGREAWPLRHLTDPRAQALTAEVRPEFMRYADDGRFAPWLVQPAELAHRYVQVCRDLGRTVRLFFCTEQEASSAEGTLVGWDVVSASLDYSVVDDELAHKDSVFTEWRARLNRFGLFDSSVDLDQFIARRRQMEAQGVNVESLEGTYRFAVYSVS
jgi:hypothetical protein